MPEMIYQDFVGKDLRFKQGDKVPKWMFSGECEFGVNVLIIPLKDKVYVFGDFGTNGNKVLIKTHSKSGTICQKCPQINYYTIKEDIFVYKNSMKS